MKDLKEQLADILAEYGDELSEEVEDTITKVGKDVTKRLRDVSDQKHHNTGSYAKGWTVTKIEKTWKGYDVTIYNKNKTGLAHLLNNGHVLRGGGRVSGDNHITDTETYAENKLFEEMEKALK